MSYMEGKWEGQVPGNWASPTPSLPLPSIPKASCFWPTVPTVCKVLLTLEMRCHPRFILSSLTRPPGRKSHSPDRPDVFSQHFPSNSNYPWAVCLCQQHLHGEKHRGPRQQKQRCLPSSSLRFWLGSVLMGSHKKGF